MKKNTSWNKVAGWYDDLLETSDDTYQSKVILPNLLRLIAPKRSETILDIACGQGFFARAFAASGATVIGTDIAQSLITLARKNALENVTLYVAPADRMTPVKSASVDQAMIVLALQNIENLQGTIAECRRVLRSNGRLHIVMNHPAFRIPGRTSWAWDEKGMQYRRVDSYLSDSHTEIEMNPSLARSPRWSSGEAGRSPAKAANKTSATTLSFHRPLQAYMKALAKHGFAITHLEEWISHRKSQLGPRAKEEDRMRREIPLFLYLGVE